MDSNKFDNPIFPGAAVRDANFKKGHKKGRRQSGGIVVNENLKITRTELEILKRIVLGQGNRDIAESFKVSERTVSSHVCNMLCKTNTPNRVTLAVWALTNFPDSVLAPEHLRVLQENIESPRLWQPLFKRRG